MERPQLESGSLHADGNRLVDELGRQVILRGVNAGGRSKFAPFLPFEIRLGIERDLEAYMDPIAGWGANVLRLPFSWEALEPAPGLFDEVYLKTYAKMIEAAWARGMRAIVDFHQDIYASPFGGDGFPPWTLGDIPHGEPRHDLAEDQWFAQYYQMRGPVQEAFDRLWDNADGILDAFAAMWRHVARRLAGMPGVIGFELINEPGWGSMEIDYFEREVLTRLIDRLGAVVRAEAPEALLFGGGPGSDALRGDTAMENPSVDGFVFAPHFYDPRVALGGRHLDPDATSDKIRVLIAKGASWSRPVLFGEFGASSQSADACAFIRQLYGLLDEHLAHGTIWEVSFSGERWNHEHLTIVEADGAELPIVDEVVRCYPLAVDGVIERFTWDPPARRFELIASAAGPGITEVCAPVRCVGAAPEIQVTGGEAERHGDLVLVRAPVGDELGLVVQGR